MKTTRFLLAATFGLALAFTNSCSSGDVISSSNEGGSLSSSSIAASSSSSKPSSSSSEPSSSSGEPSSSSANLCGSNPQEYDPDLYKCELGSNGIYLKAGVSDGTKTYKAVLIGEQVWMAENLNYETGNSSCYRGEDYSTGAKVTITESEGCAKYGRLYDWTTATASGTCPSEWHLPNNADWDKLVRYVDGTSGSESPYSSLIAGKKLKTTSGWYNNGNSEDTYGFSALPGGDGITEQNGSTSYGIAGKEGNWWSADEFEFANGTYAYLRNMRHNGEFVSQEYPKTHRYSVRCVKN